MALQTVDVCIIGSGMCGMMLAYGLEQQGVDYILLEQKSTIVPVQDDRNLVINYGSGLILSRLGLWSDNLSSYNIEQLEFSIKGLFGSIMINHNQYNVPFLGKVINAKQWMKTCFDKLNSARLRLQAKLLDIQVSHQNLELKLVTFEVNNKQQQILAKLVIGADGANSLARAKLKLTHKELCNDITSYIVPVQNSKYNHPWLRSGLIGSLAYIPHQAAAGVLILTTKQQTNNIIDSCLMLAGHRMDDMQVHGNITNYSVIAACSYNNQATLGICVGNALHSLPPIAAQGFNLGVRDCALLLQYIQQAEVIDSAQIVETFYQQRQQDIEATMRLSLLAMNVIDYTSKFGFLSSLGLLFLDNDWLKFKDKYIAQALGLVDIEAYINE